MIKRTIIFCIAISSILFGFKSSAQESNSNVTITASGRGDSQAQAQQYALRSAIEQAYGAFISSKTEILNDEIVADQMSSVANGNIQSFEILNETELPDHSWASTIKAVVSVEKLTSFVQSKGIEVEIKGGLFAANIKQQMLNEQGEVEAIYNMVGILHEIMQTAINFSIQTENPKSLDNSSENWEIPIKINATANKNLEICINYLQKTLTSISMSQEEKENYKLANKKTYPTSLNYLNQKYHSEETLGFSLRTQKSIDILCAFFQFWPFYLSNFTVFANADTMNINKLSMKEPFLNGKLKSRKESIYCQIIKDNSGENRILMNLKFISGSPITNFYFSDKKTLSEIENLTAYSITSCGLISDFSNGGITIFSEGLDERLPLTMAIISLKWSTSIEASNQIENLSLNGYDDWRFPTWDEAQFIKNNKLTLEDHFWIYNYDAEKMEFSSDYLGLGTTKGGVIAVRDFLE